MNGRRVIAATVLGSAMVFIDGTAVSVILPLLQRDLHASMSNVQWVVESYQLLLASLILVGGALGDHYGRRRIFILGVISFAAASVVCGMSPNIGLLIWARAIQGAAGALLVPGSLAIVSASFDDQARGRAIGLWSSLTSLTIILGPVVGGWLAQHFSWRWIFFINLPLAAATIVLALGIKESRARDSAALDWIGSLLATLALGSIAYGLTEWQPGEPRTLLIATTIAGLGLAAAFLWWERRVKHPMMPPSIFSSRAFSAANLLTLFLYAALTGALFFLPFNLIGVQRYTPTAAGAANLPMVILLTLLSPLAGRWTAKHGWRLPLIVGPAVAACGFALLARPGVGGSYWRTFFLPLVVLGLGMAITVAPLTTAVMSSVTRERSGIASGINNAVSRAAGLLAVAIFGMLVVSSFSAQLGGRLQQHRVPPEVVRHVRAQEAKLTDIALPPALERGTASAARSAVNESFLLAFRRAMFGCAALAALAALCGAFTTGAGANAIRDDA
jgi:EmrB/QacA subfamily drug resistance transporter